MREERERGEKGREVGWAVGMEGATEGRVGGLREGGGYRGRGEGSREGGTDGRRGGREGSREVGRDRGRGGRVGVRDRGTEGRREGGRHTAQCQAWLCT